MSYSDFDAFVDFMQDWLPGSTADRDNLDTLWDEVRGALPESVISAGLYAENEFAREQIKRAVADVGAERMAAAVVRAG